jgi:hypothetical protein
MTRVFLLVPGNLYQFFGVVSYDALANGWFIPGAIGSYIEDLFVSIVTLMAGIPLLKSLNKILNFNESLS